MSGKTEVKLIMLGELGVGKSSVLLRFKSNVFKENLKTTFIDHHKKTILVRGQEVNLSIWDTAGQEQFRSIVKSYYRHADGVLLLYDVTDVTTFHVLTSWLQEIRTNNEMAQIIVVGNKNEDPSKKSVATSIVKTFVREENLEYTEVSAKSGENVEEVFRYLTEKILVKKKILSEPIISTLSKKVCSLLITEPEEIPNGKSLSTMETISLSSTVNEQETNTVINNASAEEEKESIKLHYEVQSPPKTKKKSSCC